MTAAARPRRRGLALQVAVPVAALAILALPIAAGLWLTFCAAFGWFPAIGATEPGLGPWRDLLAEPGLATSLRLTLWTGIGSAALSLGLALSVVAVLPGRAGRVLAPFLAVPHAAMAIGLAFVLAPSGWIARLLAPLAGWDRPPGFALVGDPAGLALILGLAVKETPFLIFVSLAALGQIGAPRQMAAARALGHDPGAAWLKVILPRLWPLIRLPVMVVLAFSLSVVDMALILGPSTPPTLAVRLARAFAEPDLARMLPASAGAVLQMALTGLVLAGLGLVASGVARAGRVWIRRGGRGHGTGAALRLPVALAVGLAAAGALAVLSLTLWSFAWRWPWPALLPQVWSPDLWPRVLASAGGPLVTTLGLAAATTAAAILLAVLWLEATDRAGVPRGERVALYLPLLLPQIGFVAGLNTFFLRLGLPPGPVAVAWAQMLTVFPYVMIALADPWRRLDPRLPATAAALGLGPWRRLWRVKLPVLAAPLLAAAAVGIAVSVAQYLPTLIVGAGRVRTLTTEAVALSSGADRRIAGAWAALQAAVPLLGFVAAAAVPAIMHRNRRGLR